MKTLNTPEKWELVKISDFGKVYTGNTPPTSDAENYGIQYLFVGPADMQQSKYIAESEKRLSEKGFSVSRKFPAGSVLFTCIGSTIGKLGIASVEFSCNQQINVVVVNNANSNEFLYYQLELNANKIKLIAGEQAVPIINKRQFECIKLLRAPLAEQKAIAYIISTIDKAINTCRQLIGQKVIQKNWLLQNLMTGKKRFPSYTSQWQEIKFGDVTTNFSRRNKNLIKAEIYSVTNTNGFILQSDHFTRQIAGEDLSNYKIIRKNEFAYNPARINVGSLAYFDKEVGLISSLYVCFSTKKEILDYYLLQFLKLDHTKFKLEALGEGGVRVYLWYDLIAKIKIALPAIEEQIAIGNILHAADKEIELLKAKSEKLKQLKKGVMQQLLTGKKRLDLSKFKEIENGYPKL